VASPCEGDLGRGCLLPFIHTRNFSTHSTVKIAVLLTPPSDTIILYSPSAFGVQPDGPSSQKMPLAEPAAIVVCAGRLRFPGRSVEIRISAPPSVELDRRGYPVPVLNRPADLRGGERQRFDRQGRQRMLPGVAEIML
jgi:hypothetical protein